MKDQHGLYLKCHLLLLVDLFEKFGNNGLKNYGLYLSHYLSTAELGLDAMHNMKKVELEHFSDLDMYIFFEKGMRD